MLGLNGAVGDNVEGASSVHRPDISRDLSITNFSAEFPVSSPSTAMSEAFLMRSGRANG